MVLGTAAQAGEIEPGNPGFSLEEVVTVTTQPFQVVAFGFASNGRLFVAEKGGRVKSYDSIDDTTATEIIDINGLVHDYWDRGLLGFAVHPQFGQGSNYLYLLYSHDLIGWNDACAAPTGPLPGDPDGAAGCVVNGRLSRYTISGNTVTNVTHMLSGQWCAQFPSHTIGDLSFDVSGNLLVSAGDGASFNYVDYGQTPTRSSYPGGTLDTNACDDPSNEGGALRSQDLMTSGDPDVSYDGTVLRIDPLDGGAVAGNPSSADSRIIAHGLRNPFRITVRPGTNEVWVGDVGWSQWEEVNRIQDPGGSVENFGWPCYEGNNSTNLKQTSYDAQNLPICENLYNGGTVTAPYYARQHNVAVSGCPGEGGAISGLAFYTGARYPSSYSNALFIADYSIGCIRVMRAGGNGLPDKNLISTIITNAAPVDLQSGPDGDIFYADIVDNTIVRLVYNNDMPTAVAEVIDPVPPTGSVPLTVQFRGSASTDPEGHPLTFAWDLDGDTAYDDSTEVNPQHTYNTAGDVTVGLHVTDSTGATDTDTVVVQPVNNQSPIATITVPTAGLTWHVGETIPFSGTATDPIDGDLGPFAMSWSVNIGHCTTPTSCHEHPLQSFTGIASGTFIAPFHEYPTFLRIRLTVTDPGGLTDQETVDIQPETSTVILASTPSGLTINVTNGEDQMALTTPGQVTAVVGGTMTVDAPTSQVVNGITYNFVSWSDEGARNHTVTVPDNDITLSASYQAQGGGGGGGGGAGGGVGVGGIVVLSAFEDVPDTHPYYQYITWLAEQRITLGCAENLFCPDSPVTRGQMASFLVRAFGLPQAESDRFTDIAGSVHEADINALAARGITFGCSIDRFCPDDPVTRAQMASFLVRTLILPSGPDLFGDDEGSPHEADINALAQAGVTLGCAPLRYCPDAAVTRAEMATFLFRSFNPVRS